MPDAAPFRVGLAGTGPWAGLAHAPALASAGEIEFAGIWGRNQQAAGDLASRYQVTPYRDFSELLAVADAVAFALPPDVQAALAIRAAAAGKHVLLEKPVATTLAGADDVAGAVAEAGVASVVFFTARFQPDTRAWLAEVGRAGGWAGGQATWLGTAMSDSSPFNTPWRRDKGGLWDLGPHVVSMLWASLGPVLRVTADAGAGDLTHLVLHHDGGATSTVTVTVGAPDAADGFSGFLWGRAGRSPLPGETLQPVQALHTALGELAACARTGQPHECDAAFGRDVVAVLADAERQLAG
ncbi:MAG TPA: Gfo/Idh/MocA family oxidoreductase [Streptosporangiaceae bacterium]